MGRLVAPVTFVLVSAMLLFLGAMALEESRLRLHVRVRPRIVLFGGTVQMECRVPRSRVARAVRYGIAGPSFETSSTRELTEGHPVIFPLTTDVPNTACGTHHAYCVVELHDRMGFVAAVPQPLLFKGIGCPEEP